MTAFEKRQPTAGIQDAEKDYSDQFIDEFEEALEPSDPDIEQWDEYAARVQMRFDDELLSGSKEWQEAFSISRLCDASFDELEKAGGHTLDEEARGLIHGYIAAYGCWKQGGAHRWKEIYEEDRKLALEVEALAAKIEARLSFGARDPAVEIPFILRAYGRTIHTGPSSGPRGRPPRGQDEGVISLMAWVFRSAGGRIAISENGPFTRFLKATWELLPADNRPLSADALVAHAKASLPKLRRERPELFDKGTKWPPRD